MTRFSLVLIIAFFGISASIILAQDVEVTKSGGTVRGKIADTTTQNPIEGVQVKILAADSVEYTVATDANGEFVRTGIPPGRYLISIYKEGYEDQIGIRLIVTNSGAHNVPLKMTPKKSVLPLLEKQKDSKQNALENMTQDSHGHWYNLILMNTKIGYMHTTAEKTEYQGEPVTRNKVDTVMNFKALGTDITLEITRVEYTSTDLMPRYFLSTSNEDGLKQIEGQIVDGVAYIKTTLDGETTESEILVPPDTISEHTGVASLATQKALKIGDKKDFHIFIFDLLKPVKVELEVIGQEILTHQSEEKQVSVWHQTMDIMGGITTKAWIDSDGVTYRTEVPLMGFSMVTMKTDRETALGATEEVDIVLKTRVLPSGKPPTPKAEHFEAEVKLLAGDITEAVMSTSRQELEIQTTQSGQLSIQTPTVVADDCPELPIQNAESEFLVASAYIQAAHPDIGVKAQEILEGETNSWRASTKLCQWVYESITDKTMRAGFGSSLTVLETLSGDCTEHTVLFIALARAAGIPARICSGLVFSKDAFYYHFWPEVYVGRWVQMDPTFGQILADANHIQLGGSAMESDNLREYAVGVFRTLNQLEIVIPE